MTAPELEDEVLNWSVEIPEGKPEFAEPALPEAGAGTIRVLQLTDVHLDLSYKV